MKLYLNGITRNTDNPALITELKRAGYKEVIITLPADKPAEVTEDKSPVEKPGKATSKVSKSADKPAEEKAGE